MWAYEWDLQNRLIRVQKSESGTENLEPVTEYTYDHRGYRVKKDLYTENETETTYYTFGTTGEVLYKENTTTLKYEEFIYVGGYYFAEITGKTDETETATYFYITDTLGSVTAMTDEDGNLVWSNEYLAFGMETGSYGFIDAPNIYAGHEYDEDVNLYYCRARFMDPALGRFISEDPARDGINWYAYAGNNPLRFIDFTGLFMDDNANGIPDYEGVEKYHRSHIDYIKLHSFLTKMRDEFKQQLSIYDEHGNLIKRNTGMEFLNGIFKGAKSTAETLSKNPLFGWAFWSDILLAEYGIYMNHCYFYRWEASPLGFVTHLLIRYSHVAKETKNEFYGRLIWGALLGVATGMGVGGGINTVIGGFSSSGSTLALETVSTGEGVVAGVGVGVGTLLENIISYMSSGNSGGTNSPIKFKDKISKLNLKNKSINSMRNKLKKLGLEERINTKTGRIEFIDKKGNVRVAYDPKSQPYGGHWHKFGYESGQQYSLNNAGKVVDPKTTAAHIPGPGN